MPHAAGSVECLLSNCSSDNWNVPSLKLSANFCHALLVIFRYTAGTCVSSVVAYSDFTSKSPDCVLGKAGLFLTKLSQTISAWTLLFCEIYTKSPFFSSFSRSRNHVRVSTHTCWGKRYYGSHYVHPSRSTEVSNEFVVPVSPTDLSLVNIFIVHCVVVGYLRPNSVLVVCCLLAKWLRVRVRVRVRVRAGASKCTRCPFFFPSGEHLCLRWFSSLRKYVMGYLWYQIMWSVTFILQRGWM